MRVRRILAVCLAIVTFTPGLVFGQGRADSLVAPYAYRDTLAVQQTQPYVLRPLIIPGTETVRLAGKDLAPASYRVDYRYGQLWLLVPIVDPADTLVVAYQTLPFQLSDVYRRRRVARITEKDSSRAVAVVREEERPAGSGDPFGNLRLQRSGSITRGILAGNNRDVTVESGLRLQLAGEVVEGVEVQAVLTDENTPILPEGTTQRLDEFDKVFIQIKSRQGTAQLGDFDLSLDQTEFARFSRKLQGISVAGELPALSSTYFAGGKVTVAGATARGIFRSQDLQPLDGVQGPYRLEGQNGERFIIIIPGSEVVYLDGLRLTRGATNDYVIDYATGEITFTAERLITTDRRLTVEFQYTTNQFSRTIIGTSVETGFLATKSGRPRLALGATFLREADSRQFQDEFGFSSQDSLLVAQAGDGIATRSGAEPVPYDPEAPFVQYVRETRDRPDGGVDTVFVPLRETPGEGLTVYRVRFTRVGNGQGAYVRVGRSVNGILYEYRGPGLGDYEPVRLLPKPKQQQLFDLNGTLEPVPGVSLTGEWAQSLNDLNRLSSIDDGDDVDHAYAAGIQVRPVPVNLGGRYLGSVRGEVKRRRTGANFKTFDRTRPVEFGRRWNLLSRTVDATGGVTGGGDEQVDEAFFQWDATSRSYLRGEWGEIVLGDAFRGIRRALVLKGAETRWPALDYRLEYITSRDALAMEQGDWIRQLGRIQRPILGGRLVPHLEVEQERRAQAVLGTDSLAAPSLAFVEVRPGITWERATMNLGVELERRSEDLWLDGALRHAATAWTAQARWQFRPKGTFNTEANVGYRVKQFREVFRVRQQQQNTESLILRWNATARPFKRALDVSWFYEAQTERTPLLQEIYVRTGPELGQFVWEDSNGDGVIQVDEFVPELTPDEGTYVRTFIPSDELTSVIGVQARLRVQLDPARFWTNPGTGLRRLLSNVSTRTTVEVQEKSRTKDLAQIYLLNLSRFRDSTTVNGRLRLMQDVFLFRQNTRYGVDLSFSQVRGLTELSAGEEERFLNLWRVEGRYRPATRWNVKLTSVWERNQVLSEAFASRRYNIRSLTLAPELAFQPSPALRFSAGVAFADKKDTIGERVARVWKVPLEGRFASVRRFQVTGRFEVASVSVTGDATGLAQFELTDGRGAGTSFLWGLNGQYAVNRYLRATLSYDGRAPANAPVLHTLRMQLSAVF